MTMKRFSGLIVVCLVLALGALLASDAAAQCKDGSCSGKSGACSGATAAACPEGGACEGACDTAKMDCPFSQDLVSGKPLAQVEKPIVYNEDGRQIYFADAESLEKFTADKEAYLKKYDAAIIKAESCFYPVDYCIVSGTKFSDETKPSDIVYKNRLVRLAGDASLKAFNEDPAKYLAVLDKAVVAAQKPAYPIETCLVSGEKLGGMGEAYDMVYANVLVRFCCKGCVSSFNKNPAKYLVMLHEGWQKQKAQEAPAAGTAKATSMAGK